MLWLCLCFVFIVLARSYKVKLVNQKSKIEKTISVEANELILAKGEDVIDLPSQCRGGICNSCVGKLVTGEVDQFSEADNILSKKAIQEKYVLLCVAKPKSDLEISVDLEMEYIRDPAVWK